MPYPDAKEKAEIKELIKKMQDRIFELMNENELLLKAKKK